MFDLFLKPAPRKNVFNGYPCKHLTKYFCIFSVSEHSASFSLFTEKNTYFCWGQGVDPRLRTSSQLIGCFGRLPLTCAYNVIWITILRCEYIWVFLCLCIQWIQTFPTEIILGRLNFSRYTVFSSQSDQTKNLIYCYTLNCWIKYNTYTRIFFKSTETLK